jgi:processive 1,2-diacylglycerol beta-glucosyltransferase
MRDVLILTSGQEEHPYVARNLRDHLEELAGSDLRVEVRELGQDGLQGWLAWLRERLAKRSKGGDQVLKWVRRVADGALGQSRWPELRRGVARALEESRPELVVFFDPAVGMALQERVRDRSEAGFQRVGVALDAEDLRAWEKVPADLIWVADVGPGEALKEKNPEAKEVVAGGWPARSEFVCAEKQDAKSAAGKFRILYLVNSRRRKAVRTAERLLAIPKVEITAVVGREEELKKNLREALPEAKERLTVRGWVKDLAGLIREHDLVVTKPGTISVREILAVGQPVVLVEGGKKSNERKDMCRLVTRIGCGALADSPKAIAQRVETALEGGGVGLREWRRRARKEAQRCEGAVERLAARILQMAKSSRVTERSPELRLLPPMADSGRKQLLMVDLHAHTMFSDGRLTLRELVDFYGRRGFDALSVTDHLVDPRRLLGRLAGMTGLVLTPEDLAEYFRALAEERNRAWAKYRMILFPGLEFNHDGLTAKGSAHLLGVDLKEPIDPSFSLKEICQEIRQQGGLTIAAHPHHMSSAWGRDTLYLWERKEEYRELIDAWEIGNRDDLFNPVGLKRMPFIAGSDFHKPKHLISWKTLLFCEKDPEAIKECIRKNQDVSITLYRDHRFGMEARVEVADAKISSSVGGG